MREAEHVQDSQLSIPTRCLDPMQHPRARVRRPDEQRGSGLGQSDRHDILPDSCNAQRQCDNLSVRGKYLKPHHAAGKHGQKHINVSGPWRQNISLTFSYRDAGGTYGCDFQVYLAYTGNAGADNYYINYYAYAVNPGSTLVQCKAETGSSETVYGTGARINGVYFIKSP